TVFFSEVFADARQRFFPPPPAPSPLGAVFGRTAGRGGATEPIRHALDQRGPPAIARAVDGLLARRVHGQDVVAVDLQAGEAVGEVVLRNRPWVGPVLVQHCERLLVGVSNEAPGYV